MVDFAAIQYTPLVIKGASALFICLGAAHIVQGIQRDLPAAEHAKLPPDTIALLDSQYRYLGSMFIGYGAALGWTAYDIPERQFLLNILLAAIAVGGAGRGLSAMFFGWGIPFSKRAAIREVIFPGLIYWFGSRRYV
ncbi:hypothetical protein FGRMN_1265 [Fusarium graminum]|nr:hypothetical protein FGRMN_1265 [Fusarium graminum]